MYSFFLGMHDEENNFQETKLRWETAILNLKWAKEHVARVVAISCTLNPGITPEQTVLEFARTTAHVRSCLLAIEVVNESLLQVATDAR